MAEMQAIEDADDDEGRTELRRAAHRSPGRRPSRQPTGRRRGRDEDLVRGEAAAAAEAIATSVPSGRDQPVVVGRAGQATGRTDELALGDGSQLIRVQGNDRE